MKRKKLEEAMKKWLVFKEAMKKKAKELRSEKKA